MQKQYSFSKKVLLCYQHFQNNLDQPWLLGETSIESLTEPYLILAISKIIFLENFK